MTILYMYYHPIILMDFNSVYNKYTFSKKINA